jgi:DNA polymerase
MSELEKLTQEIRDCQRCELYQSRDNAVPGEGPEDAEILFVGEAPGWHEDRQGRPFVGAAGKYLEELLASISMTREQVYIANVLKCRPPNNRDPRPDEIEACKPFLKKQIALLRPKLVVTLGRFSLTHFLPGVKISKGHGLPRRMKDFLCYPMYHPAAALHQPKYRQAIEEDMSRIPQMLAKARELMGEGLPEEEHEQLSLF